MLLKDFDGRISTKDLKDLGMLNTMDMDAARLWKNTCHSHRTVRV